MRKQQRGMVLVLTVLLVIIVAFLGRAVVVLGPGSLARSQQSALHRAAGRAADSGLEYTAARLRENPAWRGDGNGVTVDQSGLYVVEDEGNVIGLITERDGKVSQFRIRFNYQDGGPTEDGFNDPASVHLIDNPFVSVNNLPEPAARLVPRAESGSWVVTKPDQGPYEVPGSTACILVEGRSGPALRSLDRDNPNAPTGGPMATTVAEAYFQAAINQGVADASLMGGSDITILVEDGGRVRVESKSRGQTEVPARLRSKGSVQVVQADGTPGRLEIKDGGEVGRDSAKLPGFSAAVDPGDPITLNQENVGDGKDFYNLEWGDVVQADSDPATDQAIHIPGGTYVVWDDASVHYYDKSFDDYQTFMADPANQSDPGVQLKSKDFKEIRDPANLSANPKGFDVKPKIGYYGDIQGSSWSIDKDLYVTASGTGVQELSILPRSGAAFGPADMAHTIPLTASDSFGPGNVEFQVKKAVVSVPGNLLLAAELDGKDTTITVAGDLTAISPHASMESKDGDEGGKDGDNGKGLGLAGLQLNLYVKGDLALSSYDGRDFKDFDFRGLIYTWGDFLAACGDPGASKWSKFDLQGALVAYGSDPATGSPGGAGKGAIEIRGGDVKLRWDSKKMASLLDFLNNRGSITVERTLYTTY